MITNIINDKFYIGSAIDLHNRKACHFSSLSKGKHKNSKLQRAWDKYGEKSFIFQIIEIVEDTSKLIEKEQYYLDKMNPFKESGYNICTIAKSSLGVKRSDETRKKISKAKTGTKSSEETKNKTINFWKGKNRLQRT